jgi:hypothetical protein
MKVPQTTRPQIRITDRAYQALRAQVEMLERTGKSSSLTALASELIMQAQPVTAEKITTPKQEGN